MLKEGRSGGFAVRSNGLLLRWSRRVVREFVALGVLDVNNP
jgi:hypothetical protein